jgi:hypothetical protein
MYMRKLTTVALVSAATLVFTGCPYESKFPLDTADKSKPDKSLVGTFEEKGSSDYLWKCSLDDNQYRIEKKKTGDQSDDPTIYIGWLTEVAGVQWMNVYERDDYGSSSDREYYIYKMEKKNGGDRITFKAVTDNITEEFKTPEDLKTFVKKNMELSFFYNKDDEKIFYREE